MPLKLSSSSIVAGKNMPASAFIPRRASKTSILTRYQKNDGEENIIVKIRGGGGGGMSTLELDETESEIEEEVDDEEEEEEENDSSYDEYDSEEEEENETGIPNVSDDDEKEELIVTKTSSSLKSSILSKSLSPSASQDEASIIEYDTLLTPPAMQQLFISIGVMLLSNRIDILDAKAVRIARIAFIAYIVVVQLFLLYVRLKAKSMDDRTPVMISSPLASMLPAAVTGGSGGGGNFMVKTLADQVLSSQTTVLEYDLKQAKNMNGSLLFPMIFNYFLHFKMKQVQPLIMQTATGMANLVYSPLFQVYVLGRNLERPFKPPPNPMMDALQQEQQKQEEDAEEGDTDDKTVDVEEEDGGSDDEQGDDQAADGDDEYDSDDE